MTSRGWIPDTGNSASEFKHAAVEPDRDLVSLFLGLFRNDRAMMSSPDSEFASCRVCGRHSDHTGLQKHQVKPVGE